MADILLLRSALLSVRFNNVAPIPSTGIKNNVIVKSVMDMLKKGDTEILFCGDETLQSPADSIVAANGMVVRIHVIDAVDNIDNLKSDTDITKWFLRHLRSTKKHIVLHSTVTLQNKDQSVIDIYVRAITVQKAETAVRQLENQNNARFNYAV